MSTMVSKSPILFFCAECGGLCHCPAACIYAGDLMQHVEDEKVYLWNVCLLLVSLQGLQWTSEFVHDTSHRLTAGRGQSSFSERLSVYGNDLCRRKRSPKKKDVILHTYIHTGACAQTFECTVSSNCNVVTVVLDFICVVRLLLSKLQYMNSANSMFLPLEFDLRC